MKKVLQASSVVLASLLFVHAGSATPSTTASSAAYLQILELERARSLGDGKLAAYLSDPDPSVAARAALALGRTHKLDARLPLQGCIAHPAVPVRAMCVYGLGLVGTSDDIAPILSAANDPASAVRYVAADAIGRLVSFKPAAGSAEAAAAVLKLAGSDADPFVRGHAAIALQAFWGTPAGRIVADRLPGLFAAEPNAGVRSRLMWTVGRSFAPAVPASLINAGLADPDEFVRIGAIRALAKRKGDKTVAAQLEALSNDSSWRIQLEALEALRRYSGVGPTEHVGRTPDGINLPPVPKATDLAVPPRKVPSKLYAPAADAAPFVPLAITDAASLDGEPVERTGRPRARIVTTRGTVTLVLFADWAPLTVASFESLARSGYYDGIRWFRIVPDFVVQTGDRSNTGEGDAGFNLGNEENPIEQTTGVVSMGLNYTAGGAQRDTAGSQFYLTLSPQYHLDRDFTVFGKVVDGFDVLANLTEMDSVVRVDILPTS
jgi:peptidyl-prolyl cis-trans isomerase B (cyclophilin B)